MSLLAFQLAVESRCAIVVCLWSYAMVGGAPEAYGSHCVCESVCLCICVYVCISFVHISLQRLKTKR